MRIKRIRRPPLVKRVPIGPSWQKVPCDVLMLLAAHRMLRRGDYDLVHGVEDGGILAWILSRLTGIPYVFDMDSHMSAQVAEKSPWLRPLARLVEPFEAAALRSARGVLAVCPALVEVAREHAPADRVSLLPDMPLTGTGEARPAADLEALGGTRILYVGNLKRYQGVGLLLEAFGRVADRHPDARLVIVGGSERRIAHYRRVARSLAAADRIHFAGPRPLEDLGSVLAAGHVLASPRLEGVNTPMKIYSYLGSGRPVLATRLPTHTQVLDDEHALLVEPTPEAMADGLSTLLSDPDLRSRLGARGREMVRREYGRERFRERLREFYGRMAEELEPGGGVRGAAT